VLRKEAEVSRIHRYSSRLRVIECPNNRTFFKTNKKDISDFFAHVEHGSHGSDVYKTPPNRRKLNASGPWIQLLQFLKVRFVIRWEKGHCFFNAK
jgi:hypothetical protein